MRTALSLSMLLSGCTAITSLDGYEFRDNDGGADAAIDDQDAGPRRDAGFDGGADGGMSDGGPDAGPFDAGPFDAGPFDAGPCGGACGGDTPFCDPTLGCVACIDDEHCADRNPCTVDRCGFGNVCTHPAETTCIEDLFLGFESSCAIRANGTLLCWGNDDGQYGGAISSTSARSVPGTTNTQSGGSGDVHACVQRTGGEVICSGFNAYGMLGDGTRTDHRTGFVTVAALTGATAADVGMGFYSCALRTGGAVACWGYNLHGQLGNGTFGGDSPNAANVMGITDAVSLSVGAYHTCAVRTGGGVACWGLNAVGGLGDGTMTRRSMATPVTGLAGVAQVAASDGSTVANHTCARLTSGALSCWGGNGSGQLGDGTRSSRSLPALVDGITDAVSVATGAAHTCAVRATGAVLCWGEDANGQLGDGSTADSDRPLIVPGIDAISVHAGGRHTCARLVSGQVACWGDNTAGQIGIGMTSTSSTPQIVMGL